VGIICAQVVIDCTSDADLAAQEDVAFEKRFGEKGLMKPQR